MTAPFFTIVMATYCRGRHILPTIESALDQSFTDFELLVVGDGVVDDTLDHVPKTDPRVKVIALPWNSGSQATPNNVGIAVARGRHIAYLGDDDIWMPNHLELLAQRFDVSSCDVAVSGCAYLGPPTTDLIWISGLATGCDDTVQLRSSTHAGIELDGRRHFFPPTSLAHRSSLPSEIGGWRAPDTIPAPIDADFLLRAAEAGSRFVTTGQVSALKFAAGHRYLSRLNPSSIEQCEMLAAIRKGTIDRKVCSDYIEQAKAAGTFMTLVNPDFSRFLPGEIFRQNRSNKGLDRIVPVPLKEEVYCAQTMEPPALDWYPPEQAENSAAFRWSGPSLRPKLLIPFTGDVTARITLHISPHDPANIIDEIRLRLNDKDGAHQTRRDVKKQIDLELTGQLLHDNPSVLELILPRAFCPAEAGISSDRRRLGFILTGFTIAPTTPV